SRILRRRWTAEDACGNTAEHIQEITIVDQSAPQFLETPEDMVTNCVMLPPLVALEAWDDCSDLEQDFQEERLDTDCVNEYTLIRTWTLTDGCGNQAIHTQVVEVVDDIAPILIGIPEDITVSCDEIPGIPEITAQDACGEVVEIQFEEMDHFGSSDTCLIQNADAFGTGIALWLPGVEGLNENYVLTPSGQLINQADGTRLISGEVVSTTNPNHQWIINVELSEGMNWGDWSALGRSYKDDAGLAGDAYQDWMYHVLNDENSYLVGAGDLEGSYLTLSHAPADTTFGFQEGWAANNRNADYGMSGWFFYEGNVGENEVSGPGDIIIEINCCSAGSMVRTWTATDCAGNSVSGSQVITIAPEIEFNPMWVEDTSTDAFEVSRSEGQFFAIAYQSTN
ncbi:MAG: hypothetical protein AAF193_06610, partial [Bacteroidota bacterium]